VVEEWQQRQRFRIGTEVPRDLLAAWNLTEEPLAITVLKNNPAR